jgi:hypothetical protein
MMQCLPALWTFVALSPRCSYKTTARAQEGVDPPSARPGQIVISGGVDVVVPTARRGCCVDHADGPHPLIR